MRRINFSGVLLLLLLVSALKGGFSYAAAGQNSFFRVETVSFIGVQNVNGNELAESLMAKAPPFWKFWASHPVIQINDLADDTLRIKQYYQAQGYYQAAAEYSIGPVSPQDVSDAPSHVHW